MLVIVSVLYFRTRDNVHPRMTRNNAIEAKVFVITGHKICAVYLYWTSISSFQPEYIPIWITAFVITFQETIDTMNANTQIK